MLIPVLSSSVLICIVLLLRSLFRGKVKAGVIYALWGVVLLRLLVPVQIFALPERLQEKLPKAFYTASTGEAENPEEESENIQVFTYEETMDMHPSDMHPSDTHPSDTDPYSSDESALGKPADYTGEFESAEKYSAGSQGIEGTDQNADESGQLSAAQPSLGGGNLGGGSLGGGISNNIQNSWFSGKKIQNILTVIWASVAVILFIIILISNLYLYRRIKKNRVCLSDGKVPAIYQTDYINTPCLYGILRPAIYFTPEVAQSAAGEQEYIAFHEKMHYRHRDYIWSALRVLVVCVYWFNPLVWAAARISKRDAEFAADEAVIKNMKEEERIRYGKTILGTLRTGKERGGILSMASTACSSKKEIKKRIENISAPTGTSVMAVVLLTVLALFMTACSFGGKTAGRTGGESEGTGTSSGSAVSAEILDGILAGSVSGITTEYEEDKKLDDAISEVLKDNMSLKVMTSSSMQYVNVENVIESHMLLGKEEEVDQVTAYVVMQVSGYGYGRRREENKKNESLTYEDYKQGPKYYYDDLGGESGFCTITFEKKDGGYVKKEYWKSNESGEKEMEEVRGRFPESISDEELDLTENKYMEYLEGESRKKALDSLKEQEKKGGKKDAESFEKIKTADSVTIFTYDGLGYGYTKMNDPELTEKLVDAFNQVKLVPVSDLEQNSMDLHKMIQLNFYKNYDLDRQIMFDENRICWIDGKPNAFVMDEEVFPYSELMDLVKELEAEEIGYTSPLTAFEIADWQKDHQLLTELFQDSPEINGDLIKERAEILCKIQGTTKYEEYRSQCELFAQLKKMYLAAKEEGIEITESEAEAYIEQVKQSIGLFGDTAEKTALSELGGQMEKYCEQKYISEEKYWEIVKMVYMLDFPVDKYMEKTNRADGSDVPEAASDETEEESDEQAVKSDEQAIRDLINRQTAVVSSEESWRQDMEGSLNAVEAVVGTWEAEKDRVEDMPDKEKQEKRMAELKKLAESMREKLKDSNNSKSLYGEFAAELDAINKKYR